MPHLLLEYAVVPPCVGFTLSRKGEHVADIGMLNPQKVEHAAQFILIMDQCLSGRLMFKAPLEFKRLDRDHDRHE